MAGASALVLFVDLLGFAALVNNSPREVKQVPAALGTSDEFMHTGFGGLLSARFSAFHSVLEDQVQRLKRSNEDVLGAPLGK
jgi:hypothetical protein